MNLNEAPLDERKFGTVGAVALDMSGNIAAATSTGGMTAKRWGRVGDVPVIGAGTYASNADGCAVSATGSGEYFIRATVARDICHGTANGQTLQQASDAEIAEVGRMGGDGGVQPCACAQGRNPVRILQIAHIEHQIGIAR